MQLENGYICGVRVLDAILLCTVLSISSFAAPQKASQTPKWEMFQVVLHASKTPSNPFTAVTLTATITRPDGKTLTVDGFYDGDGKGGQNGNVWKMRFSPDQLGIWGWTTHANAPALDGRTGKFECVESSSHGPIVADGNHFRYADGKHVYLIGNFLEDRAPLKERYSHTLLSEEISHANREHIIERARNIYRANKINIYLANKGDYRDISTTPWLGDDDKNDKTRFDLARWKMYDSIIDRLIKDGIVAELWFFADDSNFGNLSSADSERLIQYAMARLSAYPNTMFVLCLEWQEGWTKEQVGSAVTFGQKHNPWRRLWSVHGINGNFAFPNQPWVDFMATQPGNDIKPKDNNAHVIYNSEIGEKPLLVEEFGHAGEKSRKRLRGNLWACFCGGAAGSGTGCDLARLREFIESRNVQFWKMYADNSIVSRGFALLDYGKEYVVYLPDGGEVSVLLAPGTYEAEWFNPRRDNGGAGSMTIGQISGGKQQLTTPDGNDWVLHIKRAAETTTKNSKQMKARLVDNRWLVQNGRVMWGWAQHNGWWRPGQRPNLCRRSIGDPKGDVRPCRTEDLDKLTDSMLRFGYPGFEHNYGLWFDRRRDAHDTKQRTDSNVKPPFLEQPWARSGIGRAADGLSKYDLTEFNPWYFYRVKAFADLCDRKGTVLLYKFHMQHALLENPAHYVDYPWRPGNCTQATGLPDRLPAANIFYDVSDPTRRELHRLYIRKCLDCLGNNRNVILLPAEEYTGPLPFVQFWIDTIVEWEEERGKHVTIAVGAPKDVVDAILADPKRASAVDVLDLRYWWIRKDGSLAAPCGGKQIPGRGIESGSNAAKETSPEMVYRKVRKYRDRYAHKAIISALNADRKMSWAFFMAGGSMLVRGQIHYPNFADPPDYIKPADMDIILPSYEFIRKHLAGKMAHMRPADIIPNNPKTTWCLANPNKTYLVYALHGGEIKIDLSQASGKFAARWFDPRTGDLLPIHTITAGKVVSLNAPDGNDWVVWIDGE